MTAFAPALLLGLLATASALTNPTMEESTLKDYEKFDKLPGFYKFHEFAASYCKASKICREEGAQLMVIDSREELDVVQKLFARFPEHNIKGNAESQFWAWIGIHERGEDKDFRTSDGTPVSETTFLSWKSGYPRHPGASDCGLIERGSSLLADDPCEKLYAFICKHSPTDIDISAHVRAAVKKPTRLNPSAHLQMVESVESTVELIMEPVESEVELMAEAIVEPMLEI